MHEISLVQGMIEQLRDLAKQHQATKILSITMAIGPLSGVVVDSFRFGFEILAAEEPLVQSAKLVIDIPPVRYTCTSCHCTLETAGPRPDACPSCQETLIFPSGGDELILCQVEME